MASVQRFLTENDLKMSQECDVPESMACQIIGTLESGKTQRVLEQFFGVASTIISRLWNRLKEIQDVRSR